MRNFHLFVLVNLVICLLGCDKPYRLFGVPDSQQFTYAFESVKTISPQVQLGADPITFRQSLYTVSSEQRVLIRRGDLLSYADNINVNNGKKVEAELTFNTQQISDVITSVRICPLVRSWMMLANWQVAHPFGLSGRWSREGGDWDQEACVRGVSKGNSTTVVFDVTEWFKNQVRAQKTNNGLIVISDLSVEMIGESASIHFPKLTFSRF